MSKEEKREKTPKEKLMELLDVDRESYEKYAKKVKVKQFTRPLDEPKEPVSRLRTGTVLDKILAGGLEAGQVLDLWGKFASGKTQTVFTLAVEADGLVIFIDTEGTFSRKRIKQIAKARGKNIEAVSEKILLIQPQDWIEQEAISYQLPEPAEGERVALIVIDSLLKWWRSAPEFHGREHLTRRQQLIRVHIERFRTYARKHGAVVAFTNQVYSIPDKRPFMEAHEEVHQVGGDTIEHIPDYNIFLRKARGNIRIARLLDSSEIPLSEVAFQLNERGIDDLPKESKEKAEKSLEKYKQKHEEALWGRKTKKEKSEPKVATDEKVENQTVDVKPIVSVNP